VNSLVEILQSQIDFEKNPENGKEFLMYEWSEHSKQLITRFPMRVLPWNLAVSKVTLDIICETAFGYKTDSLHNPHNELAEAYEKLINMQSGKRFVQETATSLSLFTLIRSRSCAFHCSYCHSWCHSTVGV
jgi:hypothetical protein